MVDEIILIGPMGAGKSSVSQYLGTKLMREVRSLDSIYTSYYKACDYNDEHAQRLRKPDINAFYAYREPFNLCVVEKELLKNKGSIFDFGAYHCAYRIDKNAKHIDKILQPYPNVFLLLPCNSVEESKQVLLERKRAYSCENEQKEFLKESDYLIRNLSNSSLAKHTIVTNSDTPEEIADSIIQLIV